MVDIRDPEILLRLFIGLQFVGTSMVNMYSWLPYSFTFDQVVILILGVCSILRAEDVIRVEMMIFTGIASIILDSTAIGMYFQMGRSVSTMAAHSSYFNLSAFFAFLLLLLKPFFLIILVKVREGRNTGSAPSMTRGPWGGSQPPATSYQEASPTMPSYITMPDNSTTS